MASFLSGSQRTSPMAGVKGSGKSSEPQSLPRGKIQGGRG